MALYLKKGTLDLSYMGGAYNRFRCKGLEPDTKPAVQPMHKHVLSEGKIASECALPEYVDWNTERFAQTGDA